ncbi:MAG: hypothetical protein IPK19_42185 [Chloroflexi bacterium]|nr:hypothetical protein [Chloroflexota bacterium]
MAEGSSTTFTISRTYAVGDLDVHFAVTGAATAGSDFNLSVTSPVTIPHGTSSILVTLTALDDGIFGETGEDVTLMLLSDPSYVLGTQIEATVMIAGENLLVTNTNDSGEGSLRQAVLNANALNGIVSFDTTGAFAVPQTILLNSPLVIEGSITIDGPGAGTLTVSGQNSVRVATVIPGAAATISGVTISNGAAAEGAGILNQGSLMLLDSTVLANTAQSSGGGISNAGTLTVSNSLFEGKFNDSVGIRRARSTISPLPSLVEASSGTTRI